MIVLTRAWDADRAAEEIGATHRVIISDPSRDLPHPGIRREGDHLHLTFHDVVEPTADRVLATDEQIAALISFSHAWGGEKNLALNCYGGRSRSPASLIIALAALYPGKVRQIVKVVSDRAPHAAPNQHMIAQGDRLLDCEGRLIKAVAAMPLLARGFTGPAFFDVKTLTETARTTTNSLRL